VPWQVAFLGCWILHLHTCAIRGTVAQPATPHPSSSSTDPDGVPLQPLDSASPTLLSPTPSSFRPTTNLNPNASINHHILLLLTTLLPLAAPVLAVWVRTLLTAGFTTPFDGDHNLLAVAPFLLLVDFASWTHEPLLPVHPYAFSSLVPVLIGLTSYPFLYRCEQVLSEWSLLLLAGATFIIGARETWRIFEFASFAIAAVVAVRIGPRYWGRPPWGLRS
jgi:GPI inositol-deacylase